MPFRLDITAKYATFAHNNKKEQPLMEARRNSMKARRSLLKDKRKVLTKARGSSKKGKSLVERNNNPDER